MKKLKLRYFVSGGNGHFLSEAAVLLVCASFEQIIFTKYRLFFFLFFFLLTNISSCFSSLKTVEREEGGGRSSRGRVGRHSITLGAVTKRGGSGVRLLVSSSAGTNSAVL